MPISEHLEDSATAHGTNCQLTFQSNDGSYNLGVRVRKLGHKWNVVATESHARESRAMYPHQRAVGQFALTLELIGWREASIFANFMRTYVYSWQTGNKPTMLITMSVRNFIRRGVPIKGMQIGDHVGSMVFSPTIIFESAQDPLDPTILTPNEASKYDSATTDSDVKNFFYPFSAASEDTNVTPETFYNFGGTDDLGTTSTVNRAIGTSTSAINNSFEDALDAAGRVNGR
jgi:hypothetical protein